MPDSPAPTISTSKCSDGMVISRGRYALPSWPSFVPAIHVFAHTDCKDADARHKPGHDENTSLRGDDALHGCEQRVDACQLVVGDAGRDHLWLDVRQSAVDRCSLGAVGEDLQVRLTMLGRNARQG